MDNHINTLLTQLNIFDQVSVLKHCILKKVMVKKDNSYIFYIHSDHLLPLDEMTLLMSHKDHFPYDCSFIFDKIDEYKEKDILDYALYIFKELEKKYPILSTLDLEKLSFKNNVLSIEVVNEIQLNQIENMTKVLKKYFRQYGIDIEFKGFIDTTNDDYLQLQEEMNKENVVVVEDQPQSEKNVHNRSYNKPYKKYSYAKDYYKVLISDINNDLKEVCIEGYVFEVDNRKVKSGKTIQYLYVTDYTDSIIVKRFENNSGNSLEELNKIGKGNIWIKVNGVVEYDNFLHETIINGRNVEVIATPAIRKDDAPVKRVELHMHTKMSAMDGIASVSDYVNRAAYFGQKAIAICDHGNVQSYPEAQKAASKKGIKMIYGVEMYMVDPEFTVVYNEKPLPLRDLTFVSFDLETTGLSVLDDDIIEFGAVKVENGQIVDRLQSFIKPNKAINQKISNLTHITEDDVSEAPSIEEFFPKILDFFGNNLLIAHNATFDIGFINELLKRYSMDTLKNTWLDTMALAWKILPDLKHYRLGNLARNYRIAYDSDEAHRADYDAEVLGNVFIMMLNDLMKQDYTLLTDINQIPCPNDYKIVRPKHMCVLAKNKAGLRNIFQLVSLSNTTYFEKVPRIPRSVLKQYHEGLLFGSGCYNSELYELAMTRSIEELREAISFYDYIEILPFDICRYFVERGRIDSDDDLKRILRRIVDTAKDMDKLIVATGDVHYVDQRDKIYRDVFICNPKIGLGGALHPLTDRNNPKAWTPDEYFRTTQEMMDSLTYLSEAEKYQYTVINSNKIADMIDDNITVIHDKLYTPYIKDADKNLRELCFNTAHQQYGEVLPEIVESRLTKELDSIIKHGFGVIYYIAHQLVQKSNEAGYVVLSRGSVGSSFAATMAKITEVNPLPPHYYCPHCQYSEFIDDPEVSDGYDLPDKFCPRCGHKLKGNGHNIPFETFLGFYGDKVPDIDLNFSGDYQKTAHAYIKEIFGESHVYRAGTISTVAEKTAYGYAKGYAELMGIDDTIRGAELERIAKGCTGVKRTTGQHPGGLIVIPADMDVFDFTPYQYPADDLSAEWKTTHFDFHAIHDNVLKMDILGHVDPTVTRMLQELTGVDPKTIPTNDKSVLSLFTSTKAMGIDLSYINCKSGALGLPEFGTRLARNMLDTTQPKTFSDLIIISGLSHGTNVYFGNAETLISSGTCTITDVIGCRDDIMVYLISKGLSNKDAFDIMEVVRRGNSKTIFPEKKYDELMREHDVPSWYIESCKKIQYMFPKAHAAAYVLSSMRVAWWKLYYPKEYYAVYFTFRCDCYDIETLIKGKDAILASYNTIMQARQNGEKLSNKEEDLITVYEVALEMYERGYHFNNIDLDQSLSSTFICDPNDECGIIPSFTSVDGLGKAVGDTIVQAREQGPFLSKEDVINRTKLNNTQIDFLSRLGVFDHLSEENQMSLFDL